MVACAFVLLVMSSISQIDITAMDMLLELNSDLKARGIALHLSEMKEPVLLRLQSSSLLKNLSGKISMSTHRAFQEFSEVTEDYSI